MKFITSLAFKYIRRQKLRSILTFTSITLAVFIMNIFFVFFGTIQRSLKNNETEVSGSWEVDLSSLFTEDDNIKEKYEQIAGNAAVSDSLLSVDTFLFDQDNENSSSTRLLTLEVSDSASVSDSVTFLSSKVMAGNSDLYKEYDQKSIDTPEKDEIILPSYFSDLGYSENDTITLSVTPLIRTIKNSSPYILELAAENQIDPGSPSFSYQINNLIMNINEKDSIPFDTETYGNTVTRTFKISGFQFSSPENDSLIITEGLSDSYFLSEIFSANSDILEYHQYVNNVSLRIKDELSFSDSMDELIKDLGYKEGYYSLLAKESFHSDLLAYELKDYYGLADLTIYIFIFTVIIILCWFLSRFIIDNAFEISAQERNAQFAILRIIGSSKKQITAFTFTEAAFYSVTAIPAGTFIAVLFSVIAFNSLRDYLTYIELYINPLLTAIGITLSLLAVFISSYTSALYGSRKRSLSETYYNTYLSDNIKTGKAKKTRSSMRSGRFIRRYTLKNIFRTKKRFIISSAALATGTLMLTFSGILGSQLLIESEQMRETISESPDFSVYTYTNADKKTTLDHLRNNPLFSEVWSSTSYHTYFDQESISEAAEVLSEYGYSSNMYSFEAVDDKYFNKYLESISDISYTKFASSSQGFIIIEGTRNKCIVPEKPLTIRFDGGEVEISRIIITHTPMWGNYIMISEKSVSRILGDTKNIYGYSEICCKISDPKKYKEAIEYIKNTINPEYFNDDFIDTTGVMLIVTAVIKLAAILLSLIWLTGVISMANSVNSSVLNREHELVMMRSVGMSMKQLRNTVITESTLFSSFSTVIGIIAGTFLFRTVYGEPIKNAILAVAGIMIAVIIINTAVSVLAALPGIHNLKNKLKV